MSRRLRYRQLDCLFNSPIRLNQRKHLSTALLAIVREIHRSLVDFPNKGPVMRKPFPLACYDMLHFREICCICVSRSVLYTVLISYLFFAVFVLSPMISSPSLPQQIVVCSNVYQSIRPVVWMRFHVMTSSFSRTCICSQSLIGIDWSLIHQLICVICVPRLLPCDWRCRCCCFADGWTVGARTSAAIGMAEWKWRKYSGPALQWLERRFCAQLVSLIISLHSPNGGLLPAVRAVQRDCQWLLKNGENSYRSYELRSIKTGAYPNHISEQSTTPGWCQPVEGHVSYPTVSPTPTRLGPCISLPHCLLSDPIRLVCMRDVQCVTSDKGIYVWTDQAALTHCGLATP